MTKNTQEFIESSGYDIDNVWYPRVTKIVEIKSKPALYRFYARMENFEAGEKIKEQSAKEGTLVHETVEALLLNKNANIPENIKPSIEAFLKFQDERGIDFDPQFIESRLINHDERYAGTLDAIAKIDGKVGILDIKTSQEIYRDYNLQTSAYMAAMRDKVPDLETRWILRIDQVQKCGLCGSSLRTKGGRAKVMTKNWNPYTRVCKHEWGPMEGIIELKEFPDWQEDYHAFLGAKRLWEWEYYDTLKEIGYL
jgi:hypothetical protein